MRKNSYQFEVIISDTSSLSNLKNIGQLHLLKELYTNITITSDVFEEYQKKFNDQLPEWITIKQVKNRKRIFELMNKYHYGIGESSSIVFATENPNTLIIIDDQKPKIYASSIGLAVIGTIGIIKQAVDKNLIKSVKEANLLFDKLVETGARISPELLNDIKYPIESEN